MAEGLEKVSLMGGGVRKEQTALVDRTPRLVSLTSRNSSPVPSDPPWCRRRIHSTAVRFFLKLRVVIPEVSILPEDMEELYDLFKVGNSGKRRE